MNYLYAQATPALAALEGTLFMAYGAAGKALCWASFNGSGWTDSGQINNFWVSLSPAMASYEGSLYMAYPGSTTQQPYQIYGAQLAEGSWSDLGILNGMETASSPALAALGSDLFIAYQNTDNTIYGASYDGTTWAGDAEPITIEGGSNLTTQSAPALVATESKLYMVYVGETDSCLYFGSWSGGVATRWSFGGPVIPDVTAAGPALTALGGAVFLTYQNTSTQNICWAVLDRTGWVDLGPLTLPGSLASSSGTGLAAFNGSLVLAYQVAGGQIAQATLQWSDQGAISV